MTSAAPTVRLASAADRPRVITTVATAFSADPAWAFLLGTDYPRLAPLFAGALFDQRVGRGSVWVSDDCASAALWDRPGPIPTEVSGPAWAPFLAAADDAVRHRLEDYDAAMVAAMPSTPFWYLGVLATHPARVGQGGASRVLAAALTRVDAEGLAACLETSTDANREFYRRRGFVEATEVTVPGGPATWWLRRPPR